MVVDHPARHVIIGHGPAGLSAAEALRARAADAVIQLVSAEPLAFYSRPGLAYLLAEEVPEKQIFSRPKDHYRDLGIEVIYARATGVAPRSHEVMLDDGRCLAYDTLLLATGSEAVRPAVPGMELAGVVTLDNLPDTRAILAQVRRARWGGLRSGSAVVVGGGITALELVEGFRSRGLVTHYLIRHSHFWSSVFTDAESDLITGALAGEGVRLHVDAELNAIHGRDGRVNAVETRQGKRIGCQIVGVAVGVRPRLDLARQAGVRIDRGVLVDEHMRTSVPDIFAAGDIAQIVDPLSGEARLDVLWPTAVAGGTVAGANMAGEPLAYRKGVPFNVARLAGLPVAIIGQVGTGRGDADMVSLGRGASEGWQPRSPGETVVSAALPGRQRLMLAGNRITGAVLMGDQRLAEPLRCLIEEQVDISPIRAALLAPDADLTGLLPAFAAQTRAAPAAAEGL